MVATGTSGDWEEMRRQRGGRDIQKAEILCVVSQLGHFLVRWHHSHWHRLCSRHAYCNKHTSKDEQVHEQQIGRGDK